MKIAFSQICRDFLALRGESPSLLPLLEEGEDSAVLTLARELEVRLPEMALRATLETEFSNLEGIRSLGRQAVATPADGYHMIRLPESFLKLHRLRMSDWREPLSSTEPAGSLRRALGANAPKWMCCPANPMVTEDVDSSGKLLKVFGSNVGEVAELLFVERPVFDGEYLSIPKEAYPHLLSLLGHS